MKYRKLLAICLCLAMGMSFAPVGLAQGTADAEGLVRVHFSTADATAAPYVKKFDQFTPTWDMGSGITASTVAKRLMPAIAALAPESFRVDLFMGIGGSIGANIANMEGSTGKSIGEYLGVNSVATLLMEYDINPYFVYFANPTYTGGGREEDRWKTAPDPDLWEELCYNIALHFHNAGIRLGGHEIWNEPDFGDAFYTGSWAEMIETYLRGVQGIRRANPDALVGGLGLAEINHLYANGKMEAFLDAVEEADAPLDFISWHYYGRQGKLSLSENPFYAYLSPLRELLNARPELSTVQQHLNEFNIFRPAYDPMYRTYEMVVPMFQTMEALVSATDITRVAWACTIGNNDLGGSLINHMTNERYPAYYTLWCYARLPVDRVTWESEAQDIRVMAACDGESAGAVLYNTSLTQSRKVNVALEDLPFATVDMTVYAMDEAHPAELGSDVPHMLEQAEGLAAEGLAYEVEIPAQGAVYIEIADSEGGMETAPKVFDIARKEYWYTTRGDDCAGADLHENNMTAHVWTGHMADDQGCAVAVTLDDMLGKTLTVDVSVAGQPKGRSEASVLGLRVDYHTDAGYVKSVQHAYAALDGELTLPLGAGEKAASQPLADGMNAIALAEAAPEGWDGRILLTALANDVGRDVTMRCDFDVE